jgi:uncharacterized protein
LVRQVHRLESWSNVLTGLGNENKDHAVHTAFQHRPDRPHTEIEALYEQDGLFAEIIDAYPEDAIRAWISITAQDDKSGKFGAEAIESLDTLKARDVFQDWLTQGQLYGGALLIYGADDGQSPTVPLRVETVRKVTHLSVLTRHDVGSVQFDNNPLSPTFGDRTSFTLQNGMVVHASRCAVINGAVSSKRRLIERGGWGVPFAERVWESLRRYGSLWGYVENMFKDVVQGVMGIKDANSILLADDGAQILMRRLAAVNMISSAMNAIVHDADDEKFERRSMNWAGLDTPLLRCMDDVAAKSRIPLSRLFGQAPTGLSTDDESGTRNYYNRVASYQRRRLRDPLQRLIDMLMASGQLRKVAKYTLSFNPLEEMTDAEKATINKTKAETAQLRITSYVISEKEARSELAADPECPYALEGDEPPEKELSPEDQDLLKPEPEDEAEDA